MRPDRLHSRLYQPILPLLLLILSFNAPAGAQPAGWWNLKIFLPGLQTLVRADLRVSGGEMVRYDPRLEPAPSDLGQTVVYTGPDPLEKQRLGTARSYTREEMERLPVRTVFDILSLQTGIFTLNTYVDEIPGNNIHGIRQVHARGGRHAEVAFLIDGMQATDLVYGGQPARVSPAALSEMVVMTGGMSAEFGNGMSGVVDLVTGVGGAEREGSIELQSSDLTGAGVVPPDLLHLRLGLDGAFLPGQEGRHRLRPVCDRRSGHLG